jgi:hypothetical protein
MKLMMVILSVAAFFSVVASPVAAPPTDYGIVGG